MSGELQEHTEMLFHLLLQPQMYSSLICVASSSSSIHSENSQASHLWLTVDLKLSSNKQKMHFFLMWWTLNKCKSSTTKKSLSNTTVSLLFIVFAITVSTWCLLEGLSPGVSVPAQPEEGVRADWSPGSLLCLPSCLILRWGGHTLCCFLPTVQV